MRACREPGRSEEEVSRSFIAALKLLKSVESSVVFASDTAALKLASLSLSIAPVFWAS